MNGLAACPVLAVAPMISIVWFPPRERVTATTSMMLLGNIGELSCESVSNSSLSNFFLVELCFTCKRHHVRCLRFVEAVNKL